MQKKERIKRYIVFFIGLFFIALGIAFTKHGNLGVSPISSVANVLNIAFPVLSMGSWLMITNGILIAGQALILRKNCDFQLLLQIPISFLFGYFTDLGMLMVTQIPIPGYLMQLALVLIGILVLGFGIALTVAADVAMNAGEAFVRVLARALGKKFGNIKTAFDIGCVSLSILLSLLFCGFTIVGTREGTLLAALGTGTCVKFFTARLEGPLSTFLKKM